MVNMHHKGATPKNMKDFVLVFKSTYGFDLYDIEVYDIEDKAIWRQLKMTPGARTRFGLISDTLAYTLTPISLNIMNTSNAVSLYVTSTSRVSVIGAGPSSGLPFALRGLFQIFLTRVDGFRAGRL